MSEQLTIPEHRESVANFDRRGFLRTVHFWNPQDLSIWQGKTGDDFRSNLTLDETLVYGLLLVHTVSPGFDWTTRTWTQGEGKCVSGERGPDGKLTHGSGAAR